MVDKPGFKAITSRLYSHDDPLLERDAQFGVTRAPIVRSVRHEPGAEPAPAPGVTEPWSPLGCRFVVEPGEAWLPTPPVTAKTATRPETSGR